MSYKPGDKVSFLHEKGEGRVIKVLSAHKILVELTEGIEIEVNMKELVLVGLISLADMSARHKEPVEIKKHGSVAKPHAKDVLVVDLHAEKLDENSYSKSNQQKLSMQLDHFQDSLERAIKSHLSKIVFIHGVGNGVLRQSIHDILKRYDGIEFSDGSYQKYGAGATEVRIISRNRFKESF
jgi:dsDNA-specific endonuclease/ATPase MutS2